MANKRQPYRDAIDVSAEPAETLHAQCHPLLAGWERMERDSVRMLDEFDDARAATGFEASACFRMLWRFSEFLRKRSLSSRLPNN